MSVFFPLLTAALFASASPENFLPGEDHIVTGLVVATFGNCCILTTSEGDSAVYGNCFTNISTGAVIVADCRTWIQHRGNRALRARLVRTIGHGTMPSPQDIPLRDLVAHGPHLKHVRVRGVLEDITTDEIDPRYRIALVRDGDSFLPVPIPSPENVVAPDTLDKFLHREIELTGFYISGYPTARYFSGPVFILCGEHPLRPIGTSGSTLFSAPALPSGRIITPEELSVSGLRTLTGTVTAVWGENNLLVSAPVRRGLAHHRIELPHGSSLPRVGERIQIVGQPETDTYHINFTRARWRPAQGDPAPMPTNTPFAPDELQITECGVTRYNPDCFGRPFTIQGQITALPVAGRPDSRLRICVRDGEITVDVSQCPEALRDLPLGSTVKATGICLLEIDNWRAIAPRPRIRRPVLLLNSAQDLVLVRRPSWWTIRRIFLLTACLLAILLCVLFWNRMLNRLVISRSRELVRTQSARNASELRVGERTRLAVELHDTLSQNLAGIACQIASAAATVGSADADAKVRLAAAERMLKSCRTELRNVLSDLRSEALELPDFNDALRLVLQPLSEKCSFSIRFAVPRTHLLDTTAHAFLAIVRELAGNAIRHGRATQIQIAGSRDADGLHLSVRDNGTGFDPETAPGPATGHFGLDGIRTRLRTLGGHLTIEHATGGGTCAVVTLPS